MRRLQASSETQQQKLRKLYVFALKLKFVKMFVHGLLGNYLCSFSSVGNLVLFSDGFLFGKLLMFCSRNDNVQHAALYVVDFHGCTLK